MNLTPHETVLWETFVQGDRAALGGLFRLQYANLYKYGSKICADIPVLEDCIQELFIELWQQKTPPPAVSVKAYLLQALKYKLFRALQKNKKLAVADELPDNLAFELSHESFLIAQQEDEESARKILHALNALSNRQKEIIYLKFYQNMSYEEVGATMNINYQAARNLLYQAVKALRNVITLLLI